VRRASEAAGLLAATAVAVTGAALALPAFDSGPNDATRGGGKLAQRESSVVPSAPPTPERSRKLVWSDEFNAPAGTLPKRANWSFQQGGQWGGGRELQCYTDRRENAAHDGQGILVITVRRERYPCFDNPHSGYTSARIRSRDKREFQFGYIEARIKIPRGSGLWPAFWTVGNIGVWPDEGEFGIMEAVGSRPAALYQAVHGATLTGGHWQQREVTTGPPWSKRFHRYGVLWEPRKVTFYVDGRITSVRTAADIPAGAVWPFNSFAHYLILNVAVGGWARSPGRTARFPQAMLVDYVRVYQ
jgi:beta-glucanase (GH16 family)